MGTYAVTKGLWNVMLDTAQKGGEVRIITTSSVERFVLNEDLTRRAFDMWEASGKNFQAALASTQHFLESGIDDISTSVLPASYSFSKLADLLFALQLQKLVDESTDVKNIVVFSTHPGASYTLMTRNLDVGQMSRDQGALPNILAVSQSLDSFRKDYPNFIGPALNVLDMERYIQLESPMDDRLKQHELSVKFQTNKLDDSRPVEAMCCLQTVGSPMHYPSLRKVESDPDLQARLWQIAEDGLDQLYPTWHQLNAQWTGLEAVGKSPMLVIM